jgi:predicted small secreted protein
MHFNTFYLGKIRSHKHLSMKIIKVVAAVFLMAFLLSACASGKAGGKGCGCNTKKGMVGY